MICPICKIETVECHPHSCQAKNLKVVIKDLDAQVDAMGDQYIKAQERGADLEEQVAKLTRYIIVHGADEPPWCPIDWHDCPVGADTTLAVANEMCMACKHRDILDDEWYRL